MSSRPATDSSARRPSSWQRWAVVLGAAAVLSIHVALMSPVLDDIDAVNFALGVRTFDPTLHQPHPPGYPLYVALGRISTPIFDRLRPEPDPSASGAAGQRNAAQGLAIWSAIFGALAIWPLAWLFGRIEARGSPEAPWAATPSFVPWAAAAVAVTSPLFWFTASRPLTDVPGLVAALAIQVVLLAGAGAATGGARDRQLDASGRLLGAGALLAGAAIGLRSQTMWLTLPLLGVVMLRDVGRRAWRRVLLAGAAVVCGSLVWAVPVAVASGGVGRYLAALGDQGGADFSGVDMWFRNPTPRRMAIGLYQTFVLPWDALPLAVLLLVLASIGAFGLWRFARRSFGWLALAFGPYAVFHLLFHETETTRYALPLVPPIAYLAMVGARWIGRGVGVVVAVLVVAAGLALGTPALVRAASYGTPVTSVIAEMAARAASMPVKPVLATHHESRRVLDWTANRPFWSELLPSPPRVEWRGLVTYWRQGGTTPIWFLASSSRADLALIDPHARRLVRDARWPFRAEVYAGGARPDEVKWYEIALPGWFAGDGWSLTPETAGVAAAAGRGPSIAPVEAWVKRRPGPTTLLIGGRNLGQPGAARARIRAWIDGRLVFTTSADPAPGFFLKIEPLPSGTLEGSGTFARLTIAADTEVSGAPVPAVAIEQFDLQDEGELVYGFDAGWHEPEYNAKTGRLWRWSSDRADLAVHAGGGDMVLRLSGEDPRRYFPQSASLEVRAGQVVLGRYDLDRDFDLTVPVPAPALARAGGRLTIITDRSFVPDERSGNGDRRRLGLRVYSARVEPR